jgi:hypothetical protein
MTFYVFPINNDGWWFLVGIVSAAVFLVLAVAFPRENNKGR